jgi:hypothetical protein
LQPVLLGLAVPKQILILVAHSTPVPAHPTDASATRRRAQL